MKPTTPALAFDQTKPPAWVPYAQQAPGIQQQTTKLCKAAIDIDTAPVVTPPPGGTLPARAKEVISIGHGRRYAGPPLGTVVIENLELISGGGNAEDGIRIECAIDTLVIRNVRSIGFGVCLNLSPLNGARVKHVIVEDSAFLDAQGGTHAQSAYISGVDLITFRRVICDRGGRDAPTIFAHSAYIQQDCGHFHAQDSTFSRASSHGVQARCHHVIEECAFIENPIAYAGGGGTEPAPGGVDANLTRCVIHGGGDIDASNPRGWAMWLGNVRTGLVTGNLVAAGSGGFQMIANLDCDATGNNNAPTVGVLNTAIHGNKVSQWGGGIVIDPGPHGGTSAEPFQVVSGDFRPDTFMPGFLDAARELRVTGGQYARWARGLAGMVSP